MSPNITINNEPPSLEVKGKIIHNGRDLEERLSTIEKVLMIPNRDVILEKKYPKLKKMYEEYIKELSKCQMWESLKGEKNE
jgi:phage FluMu protein Com